MRTSDNMVINANSIHCMLGFKLQLVEYMKIESILKLKSQLSVFRSRSEYFDYKCTALPTAPAKTSVKYPQRSYQHQCSDETRCIISILSPE